MGKVAVFKMVDGLDFLVGMIMEDAIPTKQDKFKPVNGELYIEGEGGERKKVEGHKLYLKKDGKDNLKEFEKNFKKALIDSRTKEHPYKKPERLEVVISISMTEARLDEVDIDNLAKSILDCLNGIIFEDDSQVHNVLASKFVHSIEQINSVFVGVRKFKDREGSWFKNINLFKFVGEHDEED